MDEHRLLRRLAPICLALACGCSGVPGGAPRPVSVAVPPDQGTAVQAIAEPWLASGDRSGFAPLDHGNDALAARLRLIDAAESSIDLQSFQVIADGSTRAMASRLIAAADRGVRVRILIDDIFSPVSDRQLATLDAHPRVEVRIFSPLVRGVPMQVGFLAGFPQSNRRMHNKAFIVDNAIAIVGGRNMANEYFELNRSFEFADFDVLAVGPIAAEVSETFDTFWNTRLAVPLAALLPPGEPTPLPMPDQSGGTIPRGAATTPSLAELHGGGVRPDTAVARVVADRPEKLRVRRGQGEQILPDALREELALARDEVIFVTPYFVPRADGVDTLIALSARGVEVTVITNSLASTNHAIVHGGYAPRRRDLLEGGVRLYEVRPDTRVSRLTGAPVHMTLHTKAVIIDRRRALIGSLNLDPRSFELNSEMGIFIDSHSFAGRLVDRLDAELPLYAYSVRLDDEGRLVWEAGTGTDRRIWYSDPGASAWRRFVAGLVAVMPLVENQL